MRRALADLRRRLSGDAGRLDALSPLSVLGRGYALATDGRGRLIHHASAVAPGEAITVRVARGRIAAEVISTVGGGEGPPLSVLTLDRGDDE
jgi:exodeoxyribonuclease VII large subunit